MSRVANKLIAAAAGAVGETEDDEFANVVLFLDGDGTNGADNNSLDRSAGSGTINYQQSTTAGNIEQGSISPYGDYWSVYFDGSSDLDVGTSGVTNIGSGDFTVEFWINTTATGFNILNPDSSTGSGFWGLLVQSGDLRWNNSYGVTNLWVVDGAPIIDGQWHHVAVVRSSNTFAVYYDGVAQSAQSGSFSDSTNYSGSDGLRVGDGNLGNFVGWFSNIRVISGTAVYTSAFTPPTEPFSPSASYTEKALVCQSYRFIDNGDSSNAVVPGGVPTVSSFSPFKADEAKTSTNHGGSFQFTNYASQNRSRNSTYTFEIWLNFGSISGYEGIICFGDYYNAGGTYLYRQGTEIKIYHGNLLTASYNVNWRNHEWRYVTLMNSGGVHYVWVDGEYQGSSSGSTSASFYYHFTGYYNGAVDSGTISNLRVSDMRLVNAAIYNTSGNDITVPTAPLTTHASIDWLYNYGADVGFYDLSGLHHIKSLGNAQIDTSVKKYGTGSMEFDGANDELLVKEEADELTFSTFDFTVEMWAYFDVLSGLRVLIDWRNGTGNQGPYPTLYFDGTTLYFYNGANRLSATLATSTWYHIALTRENGTTRLFIDGTQSGGTYTDTTNYSGPQGGSLTIGGLNLTYEMDGYIDDLRITKGVARYTANFTPPTDALPKF